eukprot:Lithocolla_globosa_v1_NODE_207_length_5169_cov_7.885329.p6 type:complete len:116 gc:universal NODE_207_length_5169_cov_7.885329:996-649(-)
MSYKAVFNTSLTWTWEPDGIPKALIINQTTPPFPSHSFSGGLPSTISQKYTMAYRLELSWRVDLRPTFCETVFSFKNCSASCVSSLISRAVCKALLVFSFFFFSFSAISNGDGSS